MPDLLLELIGEEIPARMQAKAAEDLRRMVTDRLVEAGLVYEGAQAFVTPRRLALHVAGVPATSPTTREERKGPRVGAPEAAVAGFLKASGLARIEDATIEKDPKKGDFYVAIIEKPGRPALNVLAEILPAVIRAFPWPKSMRWGAASTDTASLRWVRPLQSIVATFGPETEEPDLVRFEVGGIASGDTTRGHRFMAPAPFRVRRLEDYTAALQAAKVIVDPARRRDVIAAEAKTLAFAQGLELVEDQGLLEEVAGLVEWPVVLMGAFDKAFLAIPDEVIRATIRANQKCFVLKDPATGRLANRFLLVANIEAKDGGAAIIAGNERVIRARLSDALYFWETDQKPLPDAATEAYVEQAKSLDLDLSKPLDQRMAKLGANRVIFHAMLQTQVYRVRRIRNLVASLAPKVNANIEMAQRAASLCKADLMTEVVGEFPEVQGLMGRRYAELQGEPPEVAAAIEEHWKPQGAGDRVPTAPVSVAVALADKLDTLVGFWAIDEKPTGSKDPYALRRAGLGVIQIVLGNSLRLSIREITLKSCDTHRLNIINASGRRKHEDLEKGHELESEETNFENSVNIIAAELLQFLADRLKVQLREQGQRHDLVDAVFALGDQDDLVLIVRRVEALSAFLATPDGAALLAGVKRAGNILRIEEKKDATTYEGTVDPARLTEPAEQALATAIATAETAAAEAVAREDFAEAMAAMARLRAPVDAFFEHVTVNAPDPALRENRLNLLARIRKATLTVADFSKIEG